MPKLTQQTDVCPKCEKRFRWPSSKKGWCWWCEGKPNYSVSVTPKQRSKP